MPKSIAQLKTICFPIILKTTKNVNFKFYKSDFLLSCFVFFVKGFGSEEMSQDPYMQPLVKNSYDEDCSLSSDRFLDDNVMSSDPDRFIQFQNFTFTQRTHYFLATFKNPSKTNGFWQRGNFSSCTNLNFTF